MTIQTATDLVRYIRHHVAGSEFQDVKTVEEFVEKQNMPNWNNVSTKLPETTGHSQDYLVVLENGDFVVAAWMNIGGWDFNPEPPIKWWSKLPKGPL